MKKIYQIILIFVVASPLFGQYEPHYTMNFVFNKLPYNPAYAGSKECTDIVALYRKQWAGLDGAPTTINASFHTPFASNKCGIGLSLTNDQIGMLNNTYAQLAYAYRIPVGNGTLSAGIQAELEFARIDWTKAIALDPNDPNVQAAAANSTKPNFGVGLYYTNPRFFAGISAPRFLKTSYYQKGSVSAGNGQKDQRTYYGMAGFIFPVTKNVMFRPMALLSYNPSAPFEWEINGSLIFARKLWVGASYRSFDSFDAFVQYELTKSLRFGAGYDFTTSSLKKVSNGSFEFMLGYLFDCCSKAQVDHIRFF